MPSLRLGKIKANDIVGLYMQNSLEWIELFWAILACGCRPLLLNTRMDKATLDKLLKSSGAIAVLSDGEQFDVKTIISTEIGKGDGDLTNAIFGEEILITSSGTSENVKICAYGARELYKQILNAEQIITNCKLITKHYKGELKLLTFLPFYHIFGLSATYMWFTFYSRTLVHLKDMSWQCIANTIRRHNVTHIFAVPLFWEKVYDEAIRKIKERGDKTYSKFKKGLKLSNKLSASPCLAKAFRKKAFREVRDNLFGESVWFMITGGGFIRPEVISFFNGIGYHLSNGYGMSEIGITSVELSCDNRVLNSCSIGKPMSSIEYAINNDGELLIKGTSLCKYYYDGGDKVYVGDSWFNSKDLAKSINGRYYLLGRADDLIVSSSGENINPNLCESKIKCQDVKRGCLIKIKRQEIIIPVLLLEVNKHISANKLKEIRQRIQENLRILGLQGEIKEVVFIGEPLIKDNEFKLNRKRLADDYVNNRLSLIDLSKEEEAFSELKGELEKQVAKCFAKALSKEVGKKDDFFLDAGGTSLDYFALISYIQEEFELAITLSSDVKLTTIEDFCIYLKEKI